MGGSFLAEALVYLIDTLLSLYILAIVLRFLLQLVRADFYNPLSQLLVTITNPALRPLRRIIPGFAGVDWPSIVLMLLCMMLQLAVTDLLLNKPLMSIIGLLVLASANIVKLVIYIYMIVIFIQIILSWVNPGSYNPATVLLHTLTAPLLRRARRYIPPVSGIDFSPMVLLIGLQLLLILLVKPLVQLAFSI